MSIAMAYPEAEAGGRGKNVAARKAKLNLGFSSQYAMMAGLVFRVLPDDAKLDPPARWGGFSGRPSPDKIPPMSPNPEMRKALALAANDNGDAPLTIEQMRFDLAVAGYADLIEEIVRNHPGLTEEEAVEHLHSFY
jgi:hypothetical protein